MAPSRDDEEEDDANDDSNANDVTNDDQAVQDQLESEAATSYRYEEDLHQLATSGSIGDQMAPGGDDEEDQRLCALWNSRFDSEVVDRQREKLLLRGLAEH